MEILTLKNGNVNVTNIERYNKLNGTLNSLRKKLKCVQGAEFNCEYFYLGHRDSSSYEGRHYLCLRHDSKRDVDLKQTVIDAMTGKIISQINEVITEINSLVS